MNFTICKTSRIPAGKRPVHLRTLAKLLNDLGVERLERYKGCGDTSQFKLTTKDDFAALWNKFEQAKAVWMNKIKQAHPDRSGAHYECAELNAIWTTIKARFAAKGIGIHV